MKNKNKYKGINVENYPHSLARLANEIGNLTPRRQSELIANLTKFFSMEAYDCFEDNKIVRSKDLYKIAKQLSKAGERINSLHPFDILCKTMNVKSYPHSLARLAGEIVDLSPKRQSEFYRNVSEVYARKTDELTVNENELKRPYQYISEQLAKVSESVSKLETIQ